MDKRLCLSNSDKKIAGVCGGVADYFNIDPTIVRIVWAVGILMGGIALPLYIICALVIPKNPSQFF
ncbi:PspC domain-containing protein [Clostridium oryzae]|uniref:DNA-binding transcriptional activator PspC n=1 Tax=Clostridium oryzae TaxID=1450648 RepID=A0A1V4IBK1_9CLOT|nr:PspC domain-containing protein [Clostridium oryzae]OPJ57316.1 DNA-binding transcriptional activator PspC [Clostridium oryzae]